MSSFLMEHLRQGQEDLESYEKAAALLLMEKPIKYRCAYEAAVRDIVVAAQEKSSALLEMYDDKDGLRREEIAAIGVKGGDGNKDVWTFFYDKLREIKEYHRRFNSANQAADTRGADDIANEALQLQKSETMFSGEEDWGRRLDLQDAYHKFINWERCRKHRENSHMRDELSRLRRKNAGSESDQDAVKKITAFEEMDYISYLKTFDRFHEVPRWLKYRDPEYISYLTLLRDYLKGFFQRQNPLADFDQVETQFEEEFKQRWESGGLQGWEEPTHQMGFYALATDRVFASSNILESHKAGKKYKKSLQTLQNDASLAEDRVKRSMAHDRELAHVEVFVQKLSEILTDVTERTIEHLQKKQSRSLRELEQELVDEEDADDEQYQYPLEEEDNDEGSDEEEKLVYNPLNLPLGWDGKPIPYWLYKLHGLGTEFKCEICGNYSYWGRRAFDRHFQEWRHAFGMRCLKIPNTVHFKEITQIEDALVLYEQLKKQAEIRTFRQDQDIECEDSQGNVMSAKAYDDLRKEGLL